MKGHVKALLQKMGYDARPVVLGPVNHETKYVLEAHPKEYERPERMNHGKVYGFE